MDIQNMTISELIAKRNMLGMEIKFYTDRNIYLNKLQKMSKVANPALNLQIDRNEQTIATDTENLELVIQQLQVLLGDEASVTL